MRPMTHSGYGLIDQTPDQILELEQQATARMKAAQPSLFQTRAPQPVVNTALMQKVKDLMSADGLEDGFSFRYLQQAVFGEELKYKPQKIGSCVASSSMRNIGDRALAEVTLLDHPEELDGTVIVGKKNLLTYGPYSYAAGRTVGGITGGRAGGQDDGSFVSAHIQGLMSYGALLCSDPALEASNYPEPTLDSRGDQLYRDWGKDATLLNGFKNSENRIFLAESNDVAGFDAVKEALMNFKPISVGSALAVRQERAIKGLSFNGKQAYQAFQDPNDEWQHAMGICGVWKYKGQWFGEVRNQWDLFHQNRTQDYFILSADFIDSWVQANVGTFKTIGELQMKETQGFAF